MGKSWVSWLADWLQIITVMLAVIVASGGALLARGLPGWVIFLVVIAAVVATLWSVVALVNLFPVLKGTRVTTENVEAHVRSWSDTFGFGVQRVDNPEAYFALALTLGLGGRHAFVARLKKTWERYIIVESSMVMTDEHKNVFKSLSPEQTEIFVEELLLQLAAAGQIGVIDANLGNITLQRRIPITPSLTEDEFIKAVDHVSIGWMIARNAVVLALKRHNTATPKMSSLIALPPTPGTAPPSPQ